ncbi:MAG: papain-like cysteine protease family protein [Opitutaceae bacterium]
MLHLLGRALCALLVYFTCTTLSAKTELREFTSSNGHTVQARVLEINAQKQSAQLEREDGTPITVEWRELSSNDVQWLKDQVAPNPSEDRSSQKADATPLPEKFILKKVPMVTQHGNFCVPASATMIAGFHGLETDQDEVAKLSSSGSIGNQGTYPSDMILAIGKLGFDGKSFHWKAEKFHSTALPKIRRALHDTGPIYISFAPGVFGEMGHGCVIIGYNDRREELTFHNPWGNVFEKTYEEVAKEGRGVVFVDPPKSAPIASDVFIKQIQKKVPKFKGNFQKLTAQLSKSKVAHELVWCSRRDERDDKSFARDTARRDGRKILELSFERNPAVLIPNSPDGQTECYYFVTRPPEGGSSFLVREITAQGWKEPVLVTLGSLTRHWTTSFTDSKSTKLIWELPMIELRSMDSPR